MRYFVLVLPLLAGCAGIEQRQVYMEHPSKTTHAEFNSDWQACERQLPAWYMFIDWPAHSYQVALCMEKRQGWHLVDDVQPRRLF